MTAFISRNSTSHIASIITSATALLIGCAQSVGPAPLTDAASIDSGTRVDGGLATDAPTFVDARTVDAMQCAFGPADGGDFPTYDRACNADADCVIGGHLASCCGNTMFRGVARRCLDTFTAAAAAWSMAHPAACGCAAPDWSETDMRGVRQTDVAAACIAGRCTAVANTECGDGVRCQPGQVCLTGMCGGACGPCPAAARCVSVALECVLHATCDCLVAACTERTCMQRVTSSLTPCRCPM